MDNYFELKIKINPEISEILSEICFEYLNCEGVVLAEEVYDDDLSSNLKLISTTEGTLKVYINANTLPSPLGGKCGADSCLTPQPSPYGGEGEFLGEFASLRNSGEGSLFAKCKQVLNEKRNLLLSRGFTEDDLGSWEFELTKVENQDWSKKWKENWDVTPVTDKITIVPSWIEYNPKPDEIIITLDPGTAFGTGTHPTTQLCMKAIEKYLPNTSPLAGEGVNVLSPCTNTSPLAGEDEFRHEERVSEIQVRDKTLLDVGTGSGILAICGIKLGAKSAYGCDNDESVIETAIENARKNNVLDKCVFEHKTADQITEKYDFITANILHNVLADIMCDLKALMNDNATLVLSGILDEKKQIVLDSIKTHGLELVEEMHQDVWVGLIVTLII